MSPPPIQAPVVSVLMTARNEAAFLPQALDSLLAQSYPHFEAVVVNDGSTDGTGAILDAYAARDNRIRPLHQEQAGRAASLNRAWQASAGLLLAIMDADDLCMPTRLEKQVAFLESHPELGLVASYYAQVDSRNQPLKTVKSLPSDPAALKNLLLTDNPICHGTVMMRRPVLESAGGYRESFPAAVDYELYLRVLDRYQMGIIPEVLYQYRVHGHSMSSGRLVQLQMKSLAQMLYHQRAETGSDSLEKLPLREQQAFISRFMEEDIRRNRKKYSLQLFELGRKYYTLGDNEAAIKLFGDAFRMNRNNFRAFRYLTRASFRKLVN